MHSTMDSVLALHPATPASILGSPNFFLLILLFIDRGQRLDNVNRTHLVLASGKLVLQKINAIKPFSKFW